MPDLIGPGSTWSQWLALGLVGTFVGVVRFLDGLYQRQRREYLGQAWSTDTPPGE